MTKPMSFTKDFLKTVLAQAVDDLYERKKEELFESIADSDRRFEELVQMWLLFFYEEEQTARLFPHGPAKGPGNRVDIWSGTHSRASASRFSNRMYKLIDKREEGFRRIFETMGRVRHVELLEKSEEIKQERGLAYHRAWEEHIRELEPCPCCKVTP